MKARAAATLISAALTVVACSAQVVPIPSTGRSPTADLPSPSPETTIAADSATPFLFSFDVENRSHVPVIVSVASDDAAELPGFEPGQLGTVTIQLSNPQNGIGIEVQGVGCRVLAKATYPTPARFTLLIDDATTTGAITLSTREGPESSPLPLPSNSLVGCGG